MFAKYFEYYTVILRGPFFRGHANVALVTAELQLYKRRSAVGMLLSDGLT